MQDACVSRLHVYVLLHIAFEARYVVAKSVTTRRVVGGRGMLVMFGAICEVRMKTNEVVIVIDTVLCAYVCSCVLYN